MKSGCRFSLLSVLLLMVVAPLWAQAPAGVTAAPAPAQPTTEPFDLEKERQKAAGTFSRVKRGGERRSPFSNPLLAAQERTEEQVLPVEEQRRLVMQAELSLGLYLRAVEQKQPESAAVHLNTLTDVLTKADDVTIPELRARLEKVRKDLGSMEPFFERRAAELVRAFEARDYERTLGLYDDLVEFVNTMPDTEREKLADRMLEMKALRRRAKARLDFAEIPLSITGVVVGVTASFATVNGRVLGEGDLVSKSTADGKPVGPLVPVELLVPPVRVAEVRLGGVTFEFEGEQMTRKVGREHLERERERGAAAGGRGKP